MLNNMKICFILGTRPEIIKLACLIKECQKKSREFIVVHTNQHYSKNMDGIFFSELDLPKPKYNLNIGSSSHATQIAQMLTKIEEVLLVEKPDVVIVQGDTNTVLSGSLVASRLGIQVAHVEAGLRSYDRSMPEEINRILTDHISDFLFCPTNKQKKILLQEGISPDKIYVTGNTVVDAVLKYASIADNTSLVLEKYNLQANKYFLLTCHRPSNTDNIKNFKEIIRGISILATKEKMQCIFPVHPRNNDKLHLIKNNKYIIPIDPVGYLDLLRLQKNSRMVFTDSGGIQEEACILKKKCIILRTNTERPETIDVGGAEILLKINANNIVNSYIKLINKKVSWKNPFGDGEASQKIFQHVYKP